MIGEEIANKLIERYEPKSVLFCPYKEEMFDSMQTIYESFLKYENIKTKIMPIPYYTLKNGKIDDLKMEFLGYYGFENSPMALRNKWDIIIFHYPYDNLNNVTRPMIMSNELKAFCKHLVLVSYACIGERQLYEQEIGYSGVRNSDLVIVETEKQAEFANKTLDGKPNWNGEFVGWGSAKYDMIELAGIPIEWEKKGEGKRVVLLQSSIVPYLKDRNKLNQIESIIKSYLKNPKVCLIWRPHPLYEDTIIAHSRGDLKKFQDLRDMVEKSEKDIFDKLVTPETAIKFADEMISDPSSLTILWKHTGKKLTMI